MEAQDIRINVHNKALDEVLISLGIEISFDSKALSEHRVTLDTLFSSYQDAIERLLSDTPFIWEKVGDVFVVLEQKNVQPDFFLKGRVVDKNSGEALPYGYVVTPDGGVIADKSGFFSIRRGGSTLLKVRASYIGYSPLDTVVSSGETIFALTPSSDSIPGVLISAVRDEMLLQAGMRSGEYKINHHVARYMPGSNDNSVFTLLHMMPGVRASNEPSSDMEVWGGKSRVTFDGFTLYGMRGFNDNIGFVNPYMVKDIRMQKGGYGVSEGGSSGAIAEINGNTGNRYKPVFKANAGTLTANGYGSIPIGNTSVFSLAYRQTFYHLYKDELFNPYNGNRPLSPGKSESSQGNPQSGLTEYVIRPDYLFRDMNLKFVSETEYAGNFYISLYGSQDKFEFDLATDQEMQLSANYESDQFAGATGYEKGWKSGGSTRVHLRFSSFANSDKSVTLGPGRDKSTVSIVNNSLKETGLKLSHEQLFGERHMIAVGLEYVSYSSLVNGVDTLSSLYSAYFSDQFRFGSVIADGGIRLEKSRGDILFLPRISLNKKINDFNITASWGLYTQYMSRIPLLFSEERERVSYVWQVHSPARSVHYIAGAAYNNRGMLLSSEFFVKRYKDVPEMVEGESGVFDINLYGFDLFAKKSIGNGSLFSSYSFHNITFPLNKRMHELKTGGMYGFRNLVLTFNYVYGSGYSLQGLLDDADRTPYSRLDVAATFRCAFDSFRVQSGISVLNLLDNSNLSYSYSFDRNDPATIYSGAVKRTPMLFVEFQF